MGKYLSHAIGFVESNDMLFFGESKPKKSTSGSFDVAFYDFLSEYFVKKMSGKINQTERSKNVPPDNLTVAATPVYFPKITC